MTEARRYAEGTTVAVEKTQDEIRSLLRKHGATHFALGDGPTGAQIEFHWAGQAFRFSVAIPTEPPRKLRVSQWDRYYAQQRQAAIDAEYRRMWRARLIWLKSVLEFGASEGGKALEDALMAYMVAADGRTMSELVMAGTVPLLGAGS